MKTLILSVLYFLTGIAFMLLQYVPGSMPEFVMKILMMPMLILIFTFNLKVGRVTTHWLLFFALIFAWAGDVLLEMPNAFTLAPQGAFFFMAGLGCFLITQLLYVILFSIVPARNQPWHKFWLFCLPVILYGAGLLWYMVDDLGAMRLPVFFYTVVILSMLIASINRYKKVIDISYYLVLTGAILFVLSDSMLAVNKFSLPFKGASPLIMTTYLAGQYLIVTGYIRQYREKLV